MSEERICMSMLLTKSIPGPCNKKAVRRFIYGSVVIGALAVLLTIHNQRQDDEVVGATYYKNRKPVTMQPSESIRKFSFWPIIDEKYYSLEKQIKTEIENGQADSITIFFKGSNGEISTETFRKKSTKPQNRDGKLELGRGSLE